MSKLIPASPDYLSFLEGADSIDDFAGWLRGDAVVTGIHEFKLYPEDEGIILTATDTTRFIAPNLAAQQNGLFKFLRTADNKFLCHKEE